MRANFKPPMWAMGIFFSFVASSHGVGGLCESKLFKSVSRVTYLKQLEKLSWTEDFSSGHWWNSKYPKTSRKLKQKTDVLDRRMFHWSAHYGIEVGLWEALDENDSVIASTDIYEGTNSGAPGFEVLRHYIEGGQIPLTTIKKFRYRHTRPLGISSEFSNGDIVNALRFKLYLESKSSFRHIQYEVSILFCANNLRGKMIARKRAYILE